MRIIFMGSPELASFALEALLNDAQNEIVCVVTQPDSPQGRNLKVRSCPVRVAALARELKMLTPANINTEESLLQLGEFFPDLIVVVAYGQILRGSVLDLPRFGCVNLHASLLPKYRGAAPIQWAIANGESVTGVTTMYMDEGMDTGDIIAQESVSIGPHDTAGVMHGKLAEVGAKLLCRTVADIRRGSVSRVPQDDAMATFASKLKKQDGRINWTRAAEAIHNRVRGFNPWPCCFCEIPSMGSRGGKMGKAGALLRVFRSSVEEGSGGAGEVLSVDGEGPLVACGEGAVRLMEVQPEGRKIMSGSAYINGSSLRVGDVLL